MLLIIDRFEGDYAVCEDENKNMVNIKRYRLPAAAKEGDILNLEGGTLEVNPEKTKANEEKMRKMMDDLWE